MVPTERCHRLKGLMYYPGGDCAALAKYNIGYLHKYHLRIFHLYTTVPYLYNNNKSDTNIVISSEKKSRAIYKNSSLCCCYLLCLCCARTLLP
jgi:hypothetical protein